MSQTEQQTLQCLQALLVEQSLTNKSLKEIKQLLSRSFDQQREIAVLLAHQAGLSKSQAAAIVSRW